MTLWILYIMNYQIIKCSFDDLIILELDERYIFTFLSGLYYLPSACIFLTLNQNYPILGIAAGKRLFLSKTRQSTKKSKVNF